MLAILTSHPIQYQVPIWRALAASGKVPFEVWHLTEHGVYDPGDELLGKPFSWHLDLLEGYPNCVLDVHPDSNLREFHGVRLRENLAKRMRRQGVRALWVEGWRFSTLWTAVKLARRCGIEVWMRSSGNDLNRVKPWKRLAKRSILGWHLARVDRFLCVGSANRRLYASYGLGKNKMVSTPHCVDNDRFAQQAAELRPKRDALREQWGIPRDAFCFLFCGKFTAQKCPLDLVRAARAIQHELGASRRPLHLLFAGTGGLGVRLRRSCRVMFDAEPVNPDPTIDAPYAVDTSCRDPDNAPAASFAGFLNQSQIAAAYVAADALVLASDASETWGLVVNEAMACGIPAIVSDNCGCAEDLPARVDQRLVFRYGDVEDLARAMRFVMNEPPPAERIHAAVDAHHLRHTVAAAEELYRELIERPAKPKPATIDDITLR